MTRTIEGIRGNCFNCAHALPATELRVHGTCDAVATGRAQRVGFMPLVFMRRPEGVVMNKKCVATQRVGYNGRKKWAFAPRNKA